MARTRKDLHGFCSWLDQLGYVPSTINNYACRVRAILRDVQPEVSTETLTAYVESQAAAQQPTFRTAWSALRDYALANGMGVLPVILCEDRRYASRAGVMAAFEAYKDKETRHETRARANGVPTAEALHAADALLRVYHFNVRQVTALTWRQVKPSRDPAFYDLPDPEAPGKSGYFTRVPARHIEAIRAWAWGETLPPRDAPFFPACAGSVEPTRDLRLRRLIEAHRAAHLLAGHG